MATLTVNIRSDGTGTINWSTFTFNAGTSGCTGSLVSGIPTTVCAGKKINGTGNFASWSLTTTWTALGVPSGATITSVTTNSGQDKCTVFNTPGALNQDSDALLTDGATTVFITGTRTLTATDASFVTLTGTDSTGLSLADADSITIAVRATLETGNSSSANVTLQQDNYQFTITYTPAGNTVALTGNAATGSPGTLAPTTTVAITGNAATASLGTLTGGTSLTGVSATGSTGTLAPSNSHALTGNAATGSEGTATAGTSVAITGNAASGSEGTLAPATSHALTGNVGSGAEGTIVPSLSVAITGNQATGALGTLTADTGAIAALTGNSTAAALGTLVPANDVPITGGVATISIGTLNPNITVLVTGLSGTGALGTLSAGPIVTVSTPLYAIATHTMNRGMMRG